MKQITQFIAETSTSVNESTLDDNGKLKNQVCIDLVKIIGEKNINRISSDDKGNNWKIILKGTDIIDLIELSKEIIKINNDSKYNCITNINLEYDTKTIIIK